MQKNLFINWTLALGISLVSFLSLFAQPAGFGIANLNYPQVELMPPVNADSLLKDDEIRNANKSQPYRFGYNHLVNFNLQNSGAWTKLPDGSSVWLLDVKSINAFSLNLAFSNFHLALGARLFVYARSKKQILGPYTSANNLPDGFFATGLIRGDEALIEYDVPAGATTESTFTLFRITHAYRDLEQSLRSYSTPFPCTNNVNCPQYAAYTNQKRSVVCIITGGNEMCSGALINDNLNDGTPYVLTANHCGTADNTWVFRFNYETSYCENTDSTQSFQYLSGGATIANNSASDFNLVKISSSPPASYHVFYSGWSRSTEPASSVTCIHHPEGQVKKCTQSSNPVSDTLSDIGLFPAECWRIGYWTDGVTAPGSSGSPLYDENKRIIGQLYGGGSQCNLPDTDQVDFYGRFEVSWDSGTTPETRLSDWLDPNNTDSLTNDGFDPNPPIDSLDLAITQILAPAGDTLCGNRVTPLIGLMNLGSSTIKCVTITYQVDAGVDSVFILKDSIVYYQPLEVTLPPIYVSGFGNHTLTVQISQPNGLTDQNPANNSLSCSFSLSNVTGLATPFYEGFDEDSFPPPGWSITIPPSGATWQQADFGAGDSSAYSAMLNEYSPDTNTSGETPELISPPISLLNLTPAAFISFAVAYAEYDSVQYDSLQLLISSDCGITWHLIYAKGGDSLATSPSSDTQFIPQSNQWRIDSVNISQWIGQSAVQFDFKLISGWGNVVYIDNVNIQDSLQVLGINDIPDMMQIKVFPNPFEAQFTLRVKLETPMFLDANLYSIDGKLVEPILKHDGLTSGSYQFSVGTAQLSPGLYFLRLNNAVIKVEKM